MKVKAVIMRPDRTNDIVVVKKKQIAGKTFQFDKTTYFLHPDRFMVTWDRPWIQYGIIPTFGIFRRYFNTYYYRQGMATPLPAPFFAEIIDKVQSHTYTVGQNGDSKDVEVKTIDFRRIADNGVSGEELAAIFNPWFYRTIAPTARDVWDYLRDIMTLGACLGVAYLIYALATGHYHMPIDYHPAAPAPAPAPTTTAPTFGG